MNKKYLIIIVMLAIVAVYVRGMLFSYCVKPSVGGYILAMSDESLSKVEVILKENLPTSFTARVSPNSPMYYTVIPSSDFNNLKETLWDNESIEITAAKQENGATYAFFHSCFGKFDLDYNIAELQEPLNKYSLEAKEVNRIYVKFEDNMRLSKTEETLYLLENESNVIRVFPDILDR
jgi:hypothetical protein